MNPEKRSQDHFSLQNLIKSEEFSKSKSEKRLYTLIIFIIIFCLIFFIFSICFCFIIAPSIGKTAGTATGSWNGITKGLSEGAKAGKTDGLSASDTEVKIRNKMTSSGNLQILLVDLSLTDLYTQGNDYAALFCLHGEGVYSVDLMQSQTFYDKVNNQIIIEIPEPVFTLYLDDSTIEKLAEYQRPLFNGSTAKGYEGYLNSKEQITEKAQKELGSDDMIKQAETLAQRQVESLAKSVCGSTASISVRFLEPEE